MNFCYHTIVKIALSLWNDKFSDTKVCKFIVGKNIVARNSNHVDLSGKSVDKYKSSIREELEFAQILMYGTF